jgi:hypothetical protein
MVISIKPTGTGTQLFIMHGRKESTNSKSIFLRNSRVWTLVCQQTSSVSTFAHRWQDTTNKDNYSMKTETNNKDCFVSFGVEADSGHKCMFTHDLLKSFPGM